MRDSFPRATGYDATHDDSICANEWRLRKLARFGDGEPVVRLGIRASGTVSLFDNSSVAATGTVPILSRGLRGTSLRSAKESGPLRGQSRFCGTSCPQIVTVPFARQLSDRSTIPPALTSGSLRDTVWRGFQQQPASSDAGQYCILLDRLIIYMLIQYGLISLLGPEIWSILEAAIFDFELL